MPLTVEDGSKVSKVLVTDPIQQVGLDVLTQRNDVVIDRCQYRPSEKDLINRVLLRPRNQGR